ncbi:hypothetical protein, partial [Klebsiella pneumoniae]
GKTLLHGDVLMWLMKTLLTSGCTNQRGAGQSEEDKAFVDKQIAVISNASLAGDYAQNNLIDIRAYNQASGRN